MLVQIFQIPCKCCTVAADIHDFFRCHINNGIQQFFIAALTRRIYNHNIGGDSLPIEVRNDFFCCPAVKLCIFDVIDLCIDFGILDCLPDNLDSNDMLCLFCQEEGYRTDSAVEVKDIFFPGKFRIIQCCAVQFSCLNRIYLIKRFR